MHIFSFIHFTVFVEIEISSSPRNHHPNVIDLQESVPFKSKEDDLKFFPFKSDVSIYEAEREVWNEFKSA